MHRVAAMSTALSRGEPYATQLPSSHSGNMVGHTALGTWQSDPMLPRSLHVEEMSSLPGFVPPHDTVNSESVMAIQPDGFGVVIWYQVGEFTCIWSSE